MSASQEYLDAARRLDTVRQEAAGARATEAAAAAEVRRDLGVLRQRIAIQRGRLVDVGHRAGLPDPQFLTAQPFTPPGAAPPATAQQAAVRAARERLDLADALLSEVDGPSLSGGPLGDWSPARRNALVYGSIAGLILVVQVVLFVATPNGIASVVGLGCSVVLPVIGFGVGWVLIGLLFQNGQRVDRTPALGVLISAAPVLLLCTGWVGTSILR